MQPQAYPPNDVRAAFEYAVYEVDFPEGPREFTVGALSVLAPLLVIVTAWNPGAVELCLDENVARNAALRAAIAARGWHSVPAENRAPDGTHVEPGFAILDAPLAEVESLAAMFGQRAIFVWDGRAGRISWLQTD